MNGFFQCLLEKDLLVSDIILINLIRSESFLFGFILFISGKQINPAKDNTGVFNNDFYKHFQNVHFLFRKHVGTNAYRMDRVIVDFVEQMGVFFFSWNLSIQQVKRSFGVIDFVRYLDRCLIGFHKQNFQQHVFRIKIAETFEEKHSDLIQQTFSRPPNIWCVLDFCPYLILPSLCRVNGSMTHQKRLNFVRKFRQNEGNNS